MSRVKKKPLMYASGISVPKTTPDKRERVEQSEGGLPPLPVYVELHSSNWLCPSVSPVRAFEAVESALEQTNVEYHSCRARFKFRCVVYDVVRVERCSFRIKFFQCPQTARVLCEFQRRAGCCVFFAALYSDVTSVVRNIFEQSPPRRREGSAPPPPTFPPSIHELTSSQIDNVLSMVRSPYLDIQREGAKVLVFLARVHSCYLATHSEFVQALADLLQVEDCQLRFCVLAALADLPVVLDSLRPLVDVAAAPRETESLDERALRRVACGLLVR